MALSRPNRNHPRRAQQRVRRVHFTRKGDLSCRFSIILSRALSFTCFEQLCAIPHGSGNTKAISDYLVRFAAEHQLLHEDAHNNVIIFAPGTPGYESAAPVILQGHMDMVCETAPDCTKDMAREGLDLFVDGDTIGARGTTLGGDDGIAVAMALAILAADDIPHPRSRSSSPSMRRPACSAQPHWTPPC